VKACGDNLVSLCVYGSAVRGGFAPDTSDVDAKAARTKLQAALSDLKSQDMNTDTPRKKRKKSAQLK